MGGWDTYYPRPQLRRESFYPLLEGWTLNGSPITLPWPPEAELARFRGRIGSSLTYRLDFTLPRSFAAPNERVILHFGAVDETARVELNGYEMFRHEGGYLPFSGDITDALSPDGNTLMVYVIDELSHKYPYGKQCADPHGMWYTPVSGIWQSVWLEKVPASGAVNGLTVDPSLEGIKLTVNSDAPEYTVEIPAAGIRQSFRRRSVSIDIPSPHLWTPDDPFLYDFTVSTDTDSVSSYFALRTVSVENRGGYSRILLNGEPVFLNGVLDQGYFHDGLYLPAEPEGYERDIARMKSLGFNALRKHIKVEPEAFYLACDRLGMLVIQDMVNSGEYNFFRDSFLPTLGFRRRGDIEVEDSPLRREFFERHCRDTILSLHNHPCIIGFTIFNEGWGQFESDRLYREFKSLDPSRFFITASGWFAQRDGDVRSEHVYFRTKRLRARDRRRALIIGECGGFSRPIAGHVDERRKNYGYGRRSGGGSDLTERIVSLYRRMVIPSIPRGLSGCVYTQLSDVEGETNGLYTYDREILKVDAGALRDILTEVNEEFSKAVGS